MAESGLSLGLWVASAAEAKLARCPLPPGAAAPAGAPLLGQWGTETCQGGQPGWERVLEEKQQLQAGVPEGRGAPPPGWMELWPGRPRGVTAVCGSCLESRPALLGLMAYFGRGGLTHGGPSSAEL